MVFGKRLLVRLVSLFSLLLILLALPKMGRAYVDPGSGAMIWQMGAAVVIGSLFYVKRIFTWAKSHLSVHSAVPVPVPVPVAVLVPMPVAVLVPMPVAVTGTRRPTAWR